MRPGAGVSRPVRFSRPKRCRRASRLAHSVTSASKSRSAPISSDWVATAISGRAPMARSSISGAALFKSSPIASSRSRWRIRPVIRMTSAAPSPLIIRQASRAAATRLAKTTMVEWFCFANSKAASASSCPILALRFAVIRVVGLTAVCFRPKGWLGLEDCGDVSRKVSRSPISGGGVADIMTVWKGAFSGAVAHWRYLRTARAVCRKGWAQWASSKMMMLSLAASPACTGRARRPLP